MIREAHIASLLVRAKEAEQEAERAKTPEAKEQWLKIAAGYRELAKMP